MKTGYTCASGYNLVASATRDGTRLIAVVLGENSNAARNARAAALLEHGFETRAWKALWPTARVRNYPRVIVGAGFEPDATMLEQFHTCEAGPTKPTLSRKTPAAKKARPSPPRKSRKKK